MKKFAFLCLVACLSGQALASQKICFWTGGNEGSRGDKLIAKITTKSVIISNHEWAGTYKREGSLEGRDGVTYLTYDAGYSDAANTILVAEGLLKAGTKGTLKIRGRGEGFFEQKFYCRDDNF